MPSVHQGHYADEKEDIEEFRLRIVRLHELFHSERARLSHSILLGDPQHSFARCGWAKTEVRLARDGHGYTFREFEEEHGEWATWCWERSTVLNPVSKYHWLREQEKQACHRALLCILRKKNDFLLGRKVLTNPRTVHVLPEHVQQLIASFITIDKEAVKSMTYMKRTLFLKNKSMAKGLITTPPTNSGSGDGASS
ncbi:MAG: hypothetical protein VX542_02190 [Cyanobacteriota bacterium]|nr:hypothetical protein [Cyanobacteriota bacterium]